MRYKPIVLAIPIAASLAVLTWLLFLSPEDRWDKQAREQTVEIARPLIAAINHYIADHAAPPSSLSDLTPQYLDQIPTPTVGSRTWIYRLDPSGIPNDPGFSLSVESTGPDYRAFYYIPTKDKWTFADF